MKKICLLTAMSLILMAAHSQTLITFGKNTVGKAEFLRAYNKNKTVVADKEKAIRDRKECIKKVTLIKMNNHRNA